MVDYEKTLTDIKKSNIAIDELFLHFGEKYGLKTYGIHGDMWYPQIRSDTMQEYSRNKDHNYFAIWCSATDSFFYSYRLGVSEAYKNRIWGSNQVKDLDKIIAGFVQRLKECKEQENLDKLEEDFK